MSSQPGLKDEDQELSLSLDTTIFSEEVILHATYRFTDRCFIHLTKPEGNRITVVFRGKEGTLQESLLGEFNNELIDQHLRRIIAQETAAIRNLIVAQAFAEADFSSSIEIPAGPDPGHPAT